MIWLRYALLLGNEEIRLEIPFMQLSYFVKLLENPSATFKCKLSNRNWCVTKGVNYFNSRSNWSLVHLQWMWHNCDLFSFFYLSHHHHRLFYHFFLLRVVRTHVTRIQQGRSEECFPSNRNRIYNYQI